MSSSLSWKTATYEQDDHTYVGFYIIEGSTMTVTHEDDHLGDRKKSAILIPGGLDELRMATMLLGEIVRELEVGVPA